jgi:ATP-dependent Clp protease ATP-binding subunit ClpA
LKDHELVLTASEEALSLLATQGYDSEFGARPLRRVIQQKVEDPLSDRVLAGEFVDGDTIKVDINEDGELVLNKGEVILDKSEETLPEPSL